MTEKQHSDQYIIKGILNGDSKILEEIYTNYSKSILNFVCQNNGTPDDAKDVIQEGLIIIFKKAKNESFNLTSSFLTYFFSVCRFIWWKKLKKNGHPTVTIEKELGLTDNQNIEQMILKKERHQFYLSKLKELSAGCRQILQLHVEGKKIKEIVSIMGFTSEGYARKRKYVCKEKLFNTIKKDRIYQELTINSTNIE